MRELLGPRAHFPRPGLRQSGSEIEGIPPGERSVLDSSLESVSPRAHPASGKSGESALGAGLGARTSVSGVAASGESVLPCAAREKHACSPSAPPPARSMTELDSASRPACGNRSPARDRGDFFRHTRARPVKLTPIHETRADFSGSRAGREPPRIARPTRRSSCCESPTIRGRNGRASPRSKFRPTFP